METVTAACETSLFWWDVHVSFKTKSFGQTQKVFDEGKYPAIPGKSRLVKYDDLA